jgi:hypothetical protein
MPASSVVLILDREVYVDLGLGRGREGMGTGDSAGRESIDEFGLALRIRPYSRSCSFRLVNAKYVASL